MMKHFFIVYHGTNKIAVYVTNIVIFSQIQTRDKFQKWC